LINRGRALSFDDVYEGLLWVASHGGRISYTDLYGGDRFAAHGRARAELGRISLIEHRAGRPLLSVIAVAQRTGRPSGGLFILAQQHDSGHIPCTCGTTLIAAGEREPGFLGRQLVLVLQEWAPPAFVLGPTFVRLDATRSEGKARDLSIDIDTIDRGTAAHKAIQNRLAEFLEANGIRARQPGPGPQFDMAWESGDQFWIAEVKSVTKANETQQLRLGLGQILDYRSKTPRPARAALVIEQEPSDLQWIDTCAGVGVTLCWPGHLEPLLAPT
jgi:hypothetical protein